jgi:hypothetical protein
MRVRSASESVAKSSPSMITLPESARVKPAQKVEKSGFAAAGGPDHGDKFSFLHAEGDATERGDVDFSYAISFVQINGFDECAHASLDLTRWIWRVARCRAGVLTGLLPVRNAAALGS